MMGIICISGAQGTGKSTLTDIVNSHLRIDTIKAPQMREIVQQVFKGVKLPQLSPVETFSSFTLRSLGRVLESLRAPRGVCDGSLLNEAAYMKGRIEVGAFGKDSRITDPNYLEMVKYFEELAFQLMEVLNIDAIVHLPIEFPAADDNYRPLDEEYRLFVNNYLVGAYPRLAVPVHVVTGTLDARVTHILNLVESSR